MDWTIEMNKSDYPYADGDKLENRNTYYYSSYEGEQFLDAYDNARLSVAENQEIKEPVRFGDVEPHGVTDRGIDTKALLQSLIGMCYEDCMTVEAWRLVAKLIQRFEVSKRLFPEYGTNWRAINSSDYLQFDLYLSFAKLMEAAYNCRSGLTELNAFLKVIDTLVSVRHLLDTEQKSCMVWLIQKEVEIIKELRCSMELKK